MHAHLEIYTSVERNQALSLIREAIGSAEGWIMNHQLFSNMSASLLAELPGDRLGNLLQDLEDKGVGGKLAEHRSAIPDHGDIHVLFAVTFIHNEPDMKRDVPPFG